MSKHLERDLDNLQQDLLALASSVEEAIHKAIRALQDREPRLAQQVIDGDSVIDEEENQIEEECLKMLALHQPVAVDLRRIVSALKINTELERMGDLAEDIAERAAPKLKGLNYSIVVRCDGELQQRELLAAFEEQGLKCEALIA